jgi:ubiquinone/menaquinone biosynthesis C-methylase UbiE
MRKTIRNLLRRAGLLGLAVRVRDFLRTFAYLGANWKYFRRGAEDGQPVPPLRLIALVTGVPDIGVYLISGRCAADSIRSVLQKNGVPFESLGAVLDFGCGCGRVVRNWSHEAGAAIIGCDYNSTLIQWCRKNLAFARFETNQLAPPLPFADESFDFIYALSVFTHMPEDLQHQWMRELFRVLKKNGHLLLTTHGEFYLRDLNEIQVEQFKREQLVVKELGDPGSNHFGAYHPYSYVEQQLSKGFDVATFEKEGALGNPSQDLYLLRKRSS